VFQQVIKYGPKQIDGMWNGKGIGIHVRSKTDI